MVDLTYNRHSENVYILLSCDQKAHGVLAVLSGIFDLFVLCLGYLSLFNYGLSASFDSGVWMERCVW